MIRGLRVGVIGALVAFGVCGEVSSAMAFSSLLSWGRNKATL